MSFEIRVYVECDNPLCDCNENVFLDKETWNRGAEWKLTEQFGWVFTRGKQFCSDNCSAVESSFHA